MISVAARWPIRALKRVSERKSELFWAWITYQSVKGIITTSLIWVPLFFFWKNSW
ncbi:MAG: hypothetical protein AAGL90_06570 [Pseudomonadota bacterium]